MVYDQGKRSKSKKAFKTDSLIQQPQNYTISDEGISYLSEAGTGQVKWEEIHKIGETTNLFVFLCPHRER